MNLSIEFFQLTTALLVIVLCVGVLLYFTLEKRYKYMVDSNIMLSNHNDFLKEHTQGLSDQLLEERRVFSYTLDYNKQLVAIRNNLLEKRKKDNDQIHLLTFTLSKSIGLIKELNAYTSDHKTKVYKLENVIAGIGLFIESAETILAQEVQNESR